LRRFNTELELELESVFVSIISLQCIWSQLFNIAVATCETEVPVDHQSNFYSDICIPNLNSVRLLYWTSGTSFPVETERDTALKHRMT